MRVAMKLTVEDVRACADTVAKIYEELALTIGPKDKVSLFFGKISRKDWTLRYLNLGSSRGFYAPKGQPYVELRAHGGPLTQQVQALSKDEGSVVLHPGDRLMLLSDGFYEGVGGEKTCLSILNEFRDKQAVDTLNELTFRVKSTLEKPDDFPSQDCSAMTFEFEGPLLRLA